MCVCLGLLIPCACTQNFPNISQTDRATSAFALPTICIKGFCCCTLGGTTNCTSPSTMRSTQDICNFRNRVRQLCFATHAALVHASPTCMLPLFAATLYALLRCIRKPHFWHAKHLSCACFSAAGLSPPKRFPVPRPGAVWAEYSTRLRLPTNSSSNS